MDAVATVPEVAAWIERHAGRTDSFSGALMTCEKAPAGVIGPTAGRTYRDIRVGSGELFGRFEPWARFRVDAATGEVMAAMDEDRAVYMPLDQWRCENAEQLRALATTRPATGP